jgi:hypothetical protein
MLTTLLLVGSCWDAAGACGVGVSLVGPQPIVLNFHKGIESYVWFRFLRSRSGVLRLWTIVVLLDGDGVCVCLLWFQKLEGSGSADVCCLCVYELVVVFGFLRLLFEGGHSSSHQIRHGASYLNPSPWLSVSSSCLETPDKIGKQRNLEPFAGVKEATAEERATKSREYHQCTKTALVESFCLYTDSIKIGWQNS